MIYLGKKLKVVGNTYYVKLIHSATLCFLIVVTALKPKKPRHLKLCLRELIYKHK